MKIKRRFSGIFFQLFLGLWSVIVVLAMLLWALSASYQQTIAERSVVDSSVIGERCVMNAAQIHAWGGDEKLYAWLANKKLNNRPEVFAIDEKGDDAVNRAVPESVKTKLKRGNPKKPLQTVVTDKGVLTLVAVRTNVPSRPLVYAFWHTPVWVHLFLAFLATLLVAALLAWYFAGPIRKLESAMRRASLGELNEKVAPTVGHHFDEIGDLAKRYDALTEKIHGLLERQKTLFHDVSHELRSPLARIEVATALMEKDPSKTPEVLKRIETEVEVLDALVEELLTYARLDKNAPIAFEKIDLVPLLEAIAENATFEGAKKEVKVVLDATGPIYLNAHVESLASAFENLTRNALRFSPLKGTITISARETKDTIAVCVADEGPGIEKDNLENLFLPFVRGKNQATGSGFGLGLAIAKRAIDRHNGTLSAENRTPHGLLMKALLKK